MAKRILLADDSITIQKVVELTFSDGDYEVTAVNNGNKAIQKLSEMRPDIILSDIIMPEKNGYEVCEYVKSHPEFRTIPVVLLTGTFEPFDPDRADKAGCDAVVTKPFESQSLIHKVEELIENAKSHAPTDKHAAISLEPPAAPAPPATPPAKDQFSTGTFQSQDNVFSGSIPAYSGESSADTPFAPPPAESGETKAFPKMSFEDLNKAAPEPASPWNQPAPTGGETRAFPKMSFEDLDKPATDARPSSQWDEPASPAPGGETRAFPKMSFEDLDQPATPPPAPSTPSEPLAPSWGSFSAPEPEKPAWEEPPALSGETKAFPKMSFEDLDKTPSEAPAPPSSSQPIAMPEAIPDASAPAAAGDLSEEQIDRIARRVVQLMSDTVIRNIAWEVIPDLAEMVVKERIRQLESE